jgi:hypothetical protein
MRRSARQRGRAGWLKRCLRLVLGLVRPTEQLERRGQIEAEPRCSDSISNGVGLGTPVETDDWALRLEGRSRPAFDASNDVRDAPSRSHWSRFDQRRRPELPAKLHIFLASLCVRLGNRYVVSLLGRLHGRIVCANSESSWCRNGVIDLREPCAPPGSDALPPADHKTTRGIALLSRSCCGIRWNEARRIFPHLCCTNHHRCQWR